MLHMCMYIYIYVLCIYVAPKDLCSYSLQRSWAMIESSWQLCFFGLQRSTFVDDLLEFTVEGAIFARLAGGILVNLPFVPGLASSLISHMAGKSTI